MGKSYLKFKNLTNGFIYIVEGKDFHDACKRSSRITRPKNRQFIGSLIQTPVNSETGLKFFAGTDIVINLENK